VTDEERRLRQEAKALLAWAEALGRGVGHNEGALEKARELIERARFNIIAAEKMYKARMKVKKGRAKKENEDVVVIENGSAIGDMVSVRRVPRDGSVVATEGVG
jgi:hypothetical protein